MPIRTILVHLDGSDAAEFRLATARAMARLFGAAVCAQFCVEAPLASVRLAVGTAAGDFLETEAGLALEGCRQLFAKYSRSSDTWLQADCEDGGTAFVRHARSADLVVMGRHDADASACAAPPFGLVESVLMQSGRPVLLLPPGLADWPAAKGVVLGWNGSAEAARAAVFARPWLRAASRVHVVMSRREEECCEADDLTPFDALARHGVDAVLAAGDANIFEGPDPAASVARRAAELGSGLVVMGARGLGPIAERLFGGATASMIRSTRMPILMSA